MQREVKDILAPPGDLAVSSYNGVVLLGAAQMRLSAFKA